MQTCKAVTTVLTALNFMSAVAEVQKGHNWLKLKCTLQDEGIFCLCKALFTGGGNVLSSKAEKDEKRELLF